MNTDVSRRKLLQQSAVAGSALLVSSTSPGLLLSQTVKNKEPEVTATEDLMREHGVIRRALLVYFECVPKLREDAAKVDADALLRTAKLFRNFGENYHEKLLEEQHIFPVIRKMNSRLANYADILIAQHARGRAITDYILAVTAGAKIAPTHAEPLARVFEGFVRMYANHAAREDTIIFPAWKTNYTNQQLDELSDQFEDIEHRMFGKDGFEDAEKTISSIEESLGFADLAQFTPPPPPKP
jgi:hemerythrin-like domain-containing protein